MISKLTKYIKNKNFSNKKFDSHSFSKKTASSYRQVETENDNINHFLNSILIHLILSTGKEGLLNIYLSTKHKTI